MKRYSIDHDVDGIYTTEDDYGDWVKWEDIKEYIESFKTCEISSVGCNCQRMYEDYKAGEFPIWNHVTGERNDEYWICPSHGYKKLQGERD